VEEEAEGFHIVAGLALASQMLLLGDEADDSFEGHLLHRLRDGLVQLPGDVEGVPIVTFGTPSCAS